MADTTKYYYEFHYPLELTSFILGQIQSGNSSNGTSSSTSSAVHPVIDNPIIDPGTREWFSQPRPFSSGDTEVITCQFKVPVTISEVSLEILRTPCVTEMWYQDRSNNWRPVLDATRVALRVPVARSDVKSYYKYSTKIYPIKAKQVQFRLTRTADPALGVVPYVVGLRNCLMKRNVYDRHAGNQHFEELIDVLGNVVNSSIKDWDARKAIDDNPNTFWKSAPMPDPSAVVSMYLDVRADDGTPRTIDRIYVDPLYNGQQLNVYYSSDDTLGSHRLSPITIPSSGEAYVAWLPGQGRKDTSTADVDVSFYQWPMAIGPLNSTACWFGVEWVPNFAAGSGPPANPVLLGTVSPTGPAYQPSLIYDVGAGEFILQLTDGTTTRTYTAGITGAFPAGDPLRVVAGWTYAPDTVYISVTNRRGEEIAHLDAVVGNLPAMISFDGTLESRNFRGTITNAIIKTEGHSGNSQAFQNSPAYYVDPDPVIPDDNGVIPSTSLDNAIYAASWTSQEHGCGGAHDSFYDLKVWTPIWRDYLTAKGMLFFPQALSMKYIKLEFSNLSEQAYPVWDAGILVSYKKFPASAVNQSTVGTNVYTGGSGFLGLGTFISSGGAKAVNWINQTSILQAIGTTFGAQAAPLLLSSGAPFITSTLPNDGAAAAFDSKRVEAASAYVYRRDLLQPYILATNAYVTTIKSEGLQTLGQYVTDIPWQDIAASNPSAVTKVRSDQSLLPVRGTDWWVYPGQQLKIPASVMNGLTGVTETVVERKNTTMTRIRFNAVSAHHYDIRFVKRDAAVAYFAGVREVTPYAATFITGEDKPLFDFPAYDANQWTRTNVLQVPSGPITTARKFYPITNRLFERNILNWIVDNDNVWSWDGTIGRWLRGTALITLDGLAHEMLSSQAACAEGDQMDVRASIRWQGLVGLASGDAAIRYGLRYYDANGNAISDGIVEEISYADWVANTNSPPGSDSTGWTDRNGTTTAPTGATYLRMLLQVTNHPTAGRVWFENIEVESHDHSTALVSKTLQTMSTFVKVAVDFRDSGLWRGDAMWADIIPDSQSIPDDKLAYYTRTIPETIEGSAWSDALKTWSDSVADWGTPFAVVNINVDPNRRYQGKRVLRFRRVAGAGEAGIKVRQWSRYVPLALFRIGAVFYKPVANNNVVILRMRRISDGVFVHEETITPVTGRWVEYVTRFIEVPEGINQEYEVYLTIDGDEEDEFYLNDLYTEVSHMRYFVRLGSPGAYLHEVTDLRHASTGRVYVTTTTPVNQIAVQATVASPDAFLYGNTVSPYYLK